MRKHLIIKGLTVCLLMLTLFSGTVFAQDGPLSAVDSKNPEQAQSKAVQESLDGSTHESKEFPEKYDLRNLNGKSYVTPVKTQGSFGTCWAHGTISTIETNLLLKGADPNTDLSEKALVWYTHHYQGSKSDPESQYEGTLTVGNEESCYDAGAFFNATAAQLASWNAACTEKEVPYTNSNGGAGKDGDWTLPYDKIHEEAYHVQNAHIILNRANMNGDVDSTVATLKQAMLDYGALYAQYFISSWNPEVNPETNAQNSPIAYPSDHAVSIVGWDDNFPKSNFYVEPPGDGAWIVKNSWGSGWLDNGYVYLSYYDPTLDKVAIIDAEFKDQDGGYTYDHNYQYDYLNNRDDRNLTIGAVNKLMSHVFSSRSTTFWRWII